MSIHIARRVIYPIIGVLVLAVFGLSLYQVYLFNFAPDPTAYAGVPAAPGIMPTADNRGAFLQLVPGSDGRFPSNLVQLLETNAPDSVPVEAAVKISPAALSAIVINQVAVGDPKEYRLYQVGAADYPIEAQRLPGGKLLTMLSKDGNWQPGQYIVDVPSGGMFDNSRLYYTFVVGEE